MKESEELLTILVAKERTTRMFMSVVVQAKSSAEFAAKRTLFFGRSGARHVAMTVKSDNEPAMSALLTQIGKLRAAKGGQRFSVEICPRMF